MKKIFLISGFLLINAFCLLSQISFYDELELTRVSADFNGVAYNGSSIIVYGNGGVILRSNDGGTIWEQTNLADTINILGVINVGSNYYGIANRRQIVYSYDNGKSWLLTELPNKPYIYRLLTHQDKIYAIIEGKILVLNQNLESAKEYPLTTDSAYYDGVVVGNKLVYPLGYGKLGYINLDNEQKDSIRLDAYKICDECPVPIRLFSNKSNLIYFFFGKNLYQYDFKLRDAKFLFTTISAPITAWNDEVFQIYSAKNPIRKIDSIYFMKFDKINKQLLRINTPLLDRFIVGTIFTHISFLSEDTIIAVGRDKLIYMSFDGGINWELKSLLNDLIPASLFLFNGENAQIIAQYTRFFHTNNGGATWLPQKNYSPVFYENSTFFNGSSTAGYFFSPMKGFIFGESSLQPYDTNIVYTDDGGETIKMKKVENLQHYSLKLPMLIITSFGKPILITHRYFGASLDFQIFQIINEDIEIDTTKYIMGTEFYSVLNRNDTLFAIGRYTSDSLSNRYYLFYSPDTASTWIEDFSFSFDTIPNSNSKEVLYNLAGVNMINDKIFLIWNFTKIIGDTIMIIGGDTLRFLLTENTSNLYVINLKEKSFKKIFQSKSDEVISKIFRLNNRYCIAGSGKTYFYWDYFEDIGSYIEPIRFIFKRYGSPQTIFMESGYMPNRWILSDTLFAFVAYDSLYRTNALLYARVKQPTSAVEEAQIEEKNSLYISRPIPNPARNSTTMRIYYDSRFDIERADFRAYNMIGMQVAGKDSFSLTRLNHYSSDLTWRFAGLPSGVYLVVVRLGGETRSAAVVVE